MIIDSQIRKQYEEYGQTPEEIAVHESLDIVAIKAKLLQVSEKYRKDIGMVVEEENPLDFTNEQLKIANTVIATNMLEATLPDGSPDYRVRQKAAEYIRDDKKGRKELRALMQGNTFNLLTFNESLQESRKKAEQAKRNMPRLVEV